MRFLSAFARSGQTITAFCGETGVPRATFTLWRREARDAQASGRTRAMSAFARVEVVPPLPSAGLTLVVRAPSGVATELSGLPAATAAALVRLMLTTRTR